MSTLKRIEARLETAAPVSVAEAERFITELKKLSPILEAAEYPSTFGRTDYTEIFVKGVANGKRALKVLQANGWTDTGKSWSPYANAISSFPVYAKGNEWPINVQIGLGGVTIHAPRQDRVGQDKMFERELMTMAKAVMPGPSKYYPEKGAASWSKSGGYAHDIMKRVFDKAKKLGFRDAGSFGDSHPTGSWVKNSSVLVHPKGWILSVGSGYGETKRGNSFSIQLSVDFKRGENKALMSKMPKVGSLVRFRDEDRDYDWVGTVEEVRNDRVSVGLGSPHGSRWVKLSQILPLPKKGDKIVYLNQSGATREGLADECAYGYMIVKVDTQEGKGKGDAYVYYGKIQTVNGKPW